MVSDSNPALPYPDNDNGPVVLRTVWILLALTSVVFACRIYTKVVKTNRLYWDDGMMGFALAVGYLHAALLTVAISHGLGRHLAYLTAAERTQTLRWGFATLGPAFMSPMLGRVGFCITMLFLTGTDPRVKKWPIWLFIVLQIVINVAALLAFYTQCGAHPDILWDPKKESRFFTACENPRIQTDIGYAQGSFNVVTDLFLTVLPAVLIEHTRLSLKTKIGLALLLCMSVLYADLLVPSTLADVLTLSDRAMIASIVKTYEARVLSAILDYTHDLFPYIIWMSIELNIVIIVASIPLLRPLFRRKGHTAQIQALKWDTSTIGSIFTKNGAKATLSRVDSEENIIQRPQSQETPIEMQPGTGITVTQQVEVRYETSNSPYVHAALVGLVQGEIANPKLVQR